MEPALRLRITSQLGVNGKGMPGWRRAPQLALAALWLLDAVLQYQTFMFSQGFPRMPAATAAGNPDPEADPGRARTRRSHPARDEAAGRAQLCEGSGTARSTPVTLRAAACGSVSGPMRSDQDQ